MGYYKKNRGPVVRIPFPTDVKLSDFQAAIEDRWMHERHNLILQAVAGSGKSFTIALLCHRDPDKSIGLYTSFMVAIVEAMQPRLPEHIWCKGAHALGRQAIIENWGVKINTDLGKWKIKNYIKELSYMWDKDDPSSDERVDNAVNLVSKMKLTLTRPDQLKRIQQLCDIYDIEIDCWEKFVIHGLPLVFAEDDRLSKQGIIDFDDMIYLVVKYDLKVRQYTRVFVDECQDFSPLLQKFVKKFVAPNGYICMVGDTYQSIMGFAGADTRSMTVMKDMFEAVELPLSVCYRCHKGAIELAQQIVPHILPHPNAIQGEVQHIKAGIDELDWSQVKKECMILCRRNAPLVRPAFKLLREGVRATIKGRNLGDGLIRLINKLTPDSDSVPKLLDALEQYTHDKKKEILMRKTVNMALIEHAEDQQAVIEAFCENASSSVEVCLKIKRIFDDDAEDGVILSTAHRSKGLEHDNVYILDYPNIEVKREGQSDDAVQQEKNLHYVALTRPKQFLGLFPAA